MLKLSLSFTFAGLALTLTGAHAAPEIPPKAARPAMLPVSLLNTLQPLRLAAGVDYSDAAFTRAVVELEQCRDAQSRAERRAERGALSRKALEESRDATRKAQIAVEKLRQLRAARLADNVTIVVDGGGINTFLPSTTSLPTFRPLAALPVTAPRPTLPNMSVTVSALPSATALPSIQAPQSVTARTLSTSALSDTAPLLARPESGRSEGSISAPTLSTRTQLESPHKAGPHLPMTPIASLPSALSAKTAFPVVARIAIAPKPTPPSVSTPAVVAPAHPAPNSVKPTPDTSNDSHTRLAQLEAQLNHAEKRLNAADAALSEGQRQLTQFAGTLRQAMLEAGPEATGLHPFVKIAEKYAGTPYIWGGESRGGFDCSGLIILVMRELGYKTPPHSAAEQFKYGVPIAQPLLKPGDLVFFANTYKPGISHVGIYLGKRRFIHAAGTGKGTIVSSLDTAHFQEKYAGARRLVQAH